MSEPGRGLHRRIPELAEFYLREQHEAKQDGQLEYAGHGGEHVVFKIKQREDREGAYRSVVAKASMQYIRRGIDLWATSQRRIDPSEQVAGEMETREAFVQRRREEGLTYMEEDLVQERKFFAAAKKYFSKEHFLYARGAIRTVPVSPSVVKELLADLNYDIKPPSEALQIDTIVRYQQMLPEEVELGREGVSSLGMRYLERLNISFDDYVRINAQTLMGKEGLDTDVFFKSLHGQTVELLKQAEEDEELKEVLRELIENMIEFTNSSEQMLDMAGPGNIRVYKNEEGKWDYLLMDIYAGGQWSLAAETTQGLAHLKGTLPRGLVTDLTNGMNYARALNGMAKVLGVEKRIELFKEQDMYESTVRMFSCVALSSVRSAFHWPDRKEFPEPDRTPVPPKEYEPTQKRLRADQEITMADDPQESTKKDVPGEEL